MKDTNDKSVYLEKKMVFLTLNEIELKKGVWRQFWRVPIIPLLIKIIKKTFHKNN